MKNARNETSDNADIDNQAPPTMMIRNIIQECKNSTVELWCNALNGDGNHDHDGKQNRQW